MASLLPMVSLNCLKHGLRTVKLIVFGVLTFLGLLSCTGAFLKIGYNNADMFVLRRIDSYFKLTGEQRSVLKGQLRTHHDWHRANELPKYIALLATARGYATDGLTQAEIEEIWLRAEERRDALLREIIPDAANFLSTLSVEQIAYFEKKVLEEFAVLEREEAEPFAEKQKKREDRFIKNYEEWYGAVSRNQRENLAFLARSVPSFSDGLASYRRERLNEFIRHLQTQRGDVEANKKILTRYLVNPVAGFPEKRRQQVQAFFAGLKKYMVLADRLATEKQRQHLLKTLFTWEERFRALLH